MSRNAEDFLLLDLSNHQKVIGTLYDGIEKHNLDDYENRWRPLMNKAVEEALLKLRKGIACSYPEDFKWDWDAKMQHATAYSAKQFAVEFHGSTEGLMQIQFDMHRSRFESSKDILYIKYLQTAPWNRPIMTNTPKYKLIGSGLVAKAILESYEAEFNGRIGLHSLPSSMSFYSKLGMHNFGPDSENNQNLTYFEMESTKAEQFLQAMRRGES